MCACCSSFISFFFNATATTEIYTLSLHDALPISRRRAAGAEVDERALRRRLSGGDDQRCERSRRARGLQSPVRSDRKSTRLNSSHTVISYAVFCLKKKKHERQTPKPCSHQNTTLP